MEGKTSQSPLPQKITVKPTELKLLDFYDALRAMVDGKMATREEWDNKTIYGVLNESRLRLHKEDGKLYEWIINDGDILGTDWIIL
jgi:hypothetical protein